MHAPSSPITRRSLLKGAISGAALGPLTVLGGLASPPRSQAARVARAPQPASAFDTGVVAAWSDLLGHLIRTTRGFSPPVASRAIGYAGVALYEALLPGMRDHRSLAGQLTGMPAMPAAGRNAAYAWPVVASAALAEIVRRLFPTALPDGLRAIGSLAASIEATAPRGIRERSADRGRLVAQAVFDWSAVDGGHEGYLRNFPPAYRSPVGDGLWVPTPPAFLPPLQPFWGGNRTFLPAPSACEPGPPPAYSTDPASACFAEADEVYRTVNGLTPEQLAIARFWADDPGQTPTPPGHSLAILAHVLRQRGADLATAAESLARLGIAVSDAFVACWRTKYAHHLLRPITYVREVIDPGWGDPLPVTTPPFPEYTSGHSVQSAAAATVLTAQFGAMSFVDRTHESRGLGNRGFVSFDAAAAEAAISRLYGGIHFRSAIDRGLDQGRCIGNQVGALRFSA